MLVTVPLPLAFILLDKDAVSDAFSFKFIRLLNDAVSDNSINTVKSADTVPVVVIGFGLTVIPVPAEIDVKLPEPPPPPAPPPRGNITV